MSPLPCVLLSQGWQHQQTCAHHYDCACITCVTCVQEEHQGALQGQQLAVMRALLEQQVLPETAAVLATADKNAREIPTSGKERVVPKILVPLVKVSEADSAELLSMPQGRRGREWLGSLNSMLCVVLCWAVLSFGVKGMHIPCL
jgi:hypothetical protein